MSASPSAASNGGQLQTHIHGANQVTPQQQPVQYVVINSGRRSTSAAHKVEYSEDNFDSVKGLTTAQLVFAAAIVLLQIITTAINDTFRTKVIKMREQLQDDTFVFMFLDNVGTGIWAGFLMLLTACIGTCGYKKQRKGFIISHLLLNLLLFVFCFLLIFTLSTTIGGLNFCQGQGISFRRYRDDMYDANGVFQTTAIPSRLVTTTDNITSTYPTLVFYGEELSGLRGTFYCHNAIFKFWLGVDAIALICCLGQLFVTLTLVVYNSLAACSCCRSCCSCCLDTTAEAANPVISYYTQPMGTVNVMPSTPMAQLPGAAPHLQTIPGTQAIHAPIYTQPLTAQQQPTDEKWEQLPPQYSAVFQNQPR